MEMQKFAFALMLGFSSLAVASDRLKASYGNYRLEAIASEELDQAMPYADAQSAVPQRLQGLWWMDGNPLPDEFVSFAHSSYKADERTVTIKVYDQDIWSWHGTELGSFLYELVEKFKLTYELTLNRDETFIQIIPLLTVNGLPIRIPRALVNFTARYAGDGLWIRESFFLGHAFGSYNFRRVVDPQGVRNEEVFAEYLKQAPAEAYLAKKLK